MADYPSLVISAGSHEIVFDEALTTRSRSGSPKVRRTQVEEFGGFEVVHLLLTGAQKATLKAFYTANRKLAFNFTWLDGVVYPVIFADSEIKYLPQGGDRWNVTLRLWEV